MASRDDVLDQLRTTLGDVEAFFTALDDETLFRSITESAVHGEEDWSAKDHLAHLVEVENSFGRVIARSLAGEPDPAEMSGISGPREAIERQNRVNAETVVAERSTSRDQLLARLRDARRQTLDRIDAMTDDQLATPVPRSPWGDGTVAGVLSTIAGHHGRHLLQVQQGLGDGDE